MPQRSLLAIEERCAEDAGVLTVQHVWPDHGYPGFRAAAVGEGNLILHIETEAGRFTSVFRKTTTVRDAIGITLAAMGLAGAHELAYGAVRMGAGTDSLVSFGLENDAELELVAV